MRRPLCVLIACVIFTGPSLLSQDQAEPISLIQLVASPEKFNGKLVVVRGFLLIAGRPHDVVGYILYLHKEDAENNLGNSVVIVPSEQMKRDQEKIDRMYIQLTGTVRSVRISGTADSYVSSVGDITSCTVWSDPSHPVALKLLDGKSK
jgi:hypothetical protein